MDVDDPVGVLSDEIFGKNLHVPRQRDEIHGSLFQQRQLLILLLRLVDSSDREFPKLDTEFPRDRRKVWVIAHDDGHLHVPLAGIIPPYVK